MLRYANFLSKVTIKSYSRFSSMYTALLVIGDEILNGQVLDINSSFFCRTVTNIGAKVSQINIIPDDKHVISKHIRDLHTNNSIVVTSGGIGPTHDDVTYEGIAAAFNEKLILSTEIQEIISSFARDAKLDETSQLKMAMIPESSTLIYGSDKNTGLTNHYPIVKVHNVFILPGVPKLFKLGLSYIEDEFRNGLPPRLTQNLYVTLDEFGITTCINKAVEKLSATKSTIGSYPDLRNSYYKVRLSMEAVGADELAQAVAVMKQELPEDCLIEYDPHPMENISDKVYKLAENNTQFGNLLRSSLEVVEEALKRYEGEQLCVGFNGGKDCTVLLHLVAAVRGRLHLGATAFNSLYIRCREPFPEVEQFMQQARGRYGLQVLQLEGGIKEGLQELKKTHPRLQAVFMGSRKTDPHCVTLTPFKLTDADWPQFMRVNPMLEWTYTDVWTFLRTLSIPYCVLYDRGYSSLGSMTNTHPNPKLKETNAKGAISYKPAYLLEDPAQERTGRTTNI